MSPVCSAPSSSLNSHVESIHSWYSQCWRSICTPLRDCTYWNSHSFIKVFFLALRETFLHLLSWNQDEASVKPLPRPGTCTILKIVLWHKQWSAEVIANYGAHGALAICLLIIYITAWLLHRKQTLLLAASSCHIITASDAGRIPGKLCLFLPVTAATFACSPFRRYTYSFCCLLPLSNLLASAFPSLC